ncbi:MAG TPA: hypothetical protein VI564_06355 [Candidatus Nanoarchaeia archaeon]|nr:hypothetical protein [Candidatus Nanoarchaeia archaeon]
MINNKLAKISLKVLILFLLMLPLINAVSVEIKAPDTLRLGQGTNVNISVIADTPFDGTVKLAYINLNSAPSQISFAAPNFAGRYFNTTISVSAGSLGAYAISANVTDSSQAQVAQSTKTGIVDGSVPEIISYLPGNFVSKDSTVLSVRTKNSATCRYGTGDNIYDSLPNAFSGSDGTNHNSTLSGLSQGIYNYYVRCKNDNGNAMDSSLVITFTLNFLPSAKITLSDDDPVKEGTIEVTVQTSESIEDIPILEYSFNDEPSFRKPVFLTGANSLWHGYLIITEEDDNKAGTFYFSAKDSNGNIGTKITSGNIFVVDAKKPIAPISVKAQSDIDGNIKLNWYYDGEEADHFNIYRSTISGVAFVDFYSSSVTLQQFKDSSTIDKVTYYYKVSAVDKAGNEGPLSQEAFATSINSLESTSSKSEEEQAQDVPKVLPPNLVPKVDDFIKKIEKLLIDADDVSIKFQSLEGEKKELVTELGLIASIENLKSQLQNLKSQSQGFKSVYSTESELDAKIKNLDLELIKIEKVMPVDVELVEKSDYIQSTQKEDIEKAGFELLKDQSFTDDEKNAYIKKNYKKKDDIKVEAFIKVAAIKQTDGTKNYFTLVKKKLSYQKPEKLSDVVAIETIPKSVAESAGEIEFVNVQPEILKDDPVVKYGFLDFDFEGEVIIYKIGKKVNIEDIKASKSVVFLSLNEIVGTSNQLTGNSVFALDSLGLSQAQAIFAVIGVLAIIFLGAYYIFFVKNYRVSFTRLKNFALLKKFERKKSEFSEKAPEFPELPKKDFIYRNSESQFSEMGQSGFLSELSSQVKDAKADFADRLMPILANIDKNASFGNSNTSVQLMHKTNLEYVSALIEQANFHLKNNMHTEAAKIYPRISMIYQSMPKEIKSQMYDKCLELHRKMNGILK